MQQENQSVFHESEWLTYYIRPYNVQYRHFGDEFKKANNYLLKIEFGVFHLYSKLM